MVYQMPGCGPPVAVDISGCGPQVAVDLEWLWASSGCGRQAAVDLNWLWTSSAQVSVDLPQMIVGLMWQRSSSVRHSQICTNTMDLGGYTGYAPHCTVGRVTKAPPFCSCENGILGTNSKQNSA